MGSKVSFAAHHRSERVHSSDGCARPHLPALGFCLRRPLVPIAATTAMFAFAILAFTFLGKELTKFTSVLTIPAVIASRLFAMRACVEVRGQLSDLVAEAIQLGYSSAPTIAVGSLRVERLFQPHRSCGVDIVGAQVHSRPRLTSEGIRRHTHSRWRRDGHEGPGVLFNSKRILRSVSS